MSTVLTWYEDTLKFEGGRKPRRFWNLCETDRMLPTQTTWPDWKQERYSTSSSETCSMLNYCSQSYSSPYKRIMHSHFLPCDLEMSLIGRVYFCVPLTFALATRLILTKWMWADVAHITSQQRLSACSCGLAWPSVPTAPAPTPQPEWESHAASLSLSPAKPRRATDDP